MQPRDAYYSQRRDYRASVYAHDAKLKAAAYADAPQAGWERESAARLILPMPRGYGRRILDPLIVRRALRADWLATKADYRIGKASELDVYEAREALTGESPTALIKLAMKREQCAREGTPRDIAERYFADVRFFTPRPETLPRRYASRELTETERFERANPSDRRQR